EAFRLLQRQVDTMPALVDRLQAMMAAIERQSLDAGQRQIEQQTAFFERTEAVHARLAGSVEASLRDSVAAGARAAGAALQPVAETTMGALAQHAASLHEGVAQAMQRQLQDVSERLHASTSGIAALWTGALDEQRASQQALAHDLHAALDRFAGAFEQRSTQLVDTVASRFDRAGDDAAAAWSTALSQQAALGEALAQRNEQALAAAAAGLGSQAASLERFSENFEQRSADLVATVSARFEAASATATATWTGALERQAAIGESVAARNEQSFAAAADTLAGQAAALDRFASALDRRSAELVETVAARFEAASDGARAAWAEALARQVAGGEALAEANRDALARAAETFETHAASLVATLQQSHVELQAALEARTRAHAHETLAEISRLVHDAAEAPKAAAAVIAELRQNLSESMVRDTAVLEERGRLLATVETLLGAVNHAAAEQRTAVDALITTSAEALEQVATRFTAHVERETGRLDAAADRLTAGAVDVASLGDVFGEAVRHFGAANEQLVARLQAVEGALDRSLARSDEQLAYYVAQAREVVDLSVLAQNQIIGELQQLARSARAAAETA
ncbi:MAG TPA: DUF802 domain-containing protein, partial [Lysobacter sp.]